MDIVLMKIRCEVCKIEKDAIEFSLRFMYTEKGILSGCCNKCMKLKRRRKKSNPFISSEETKARARQRYKDRRQEAIAHYGGVCACCGEDRYEFLAIDHINGGGAKERKNTGSGARFLSILRKMHYPPGYRILCHNCNTSLGVYGYCPHNPPMPERISP